MFTDQDRQRRAPPRTVDAATARRVRKIRAPHGMMTPTGKRAAPVGRNIVPVSNAIVLMGAKNRLDGARIIAMGKEMIAVRNG